MILEMTDAKLVFLTLDTCHASVGVIESATFVRDHYSRVGRAGGTGPDMISCRN